MSVFINKELEGKTIIAVRLATDEEKQGFDTSVQHEDVTVIELSNGLVLIPVYDNYGSGILRGGTIHAHDSLEGDEHIVSVI